MIQIVDERDQFQAAMLRMRDAFVLVKNQLDRAGWATDKENDNFFDGYAEVKSIFGTVLLQRDVSATREIGL